MTSSFSYHDDVSKQIDDTRFNQQFYVNKRGFYNHQTDPFSRPNMVNKPVLYREMFPPEANKVEEVHVEVDCCGTPAKPIVMGKKNEDLPLENATLFWTELRSKPPPRRICRTTARIGLDQTEN